LQDLLLRDEQFCLNYSSGRRGKNVHWGQRKLLLSEMEFFLLYWDERKVPKPVCVYAGAAPGTHIKILAQLFPAFTFHLYDIREFGIPESEKVFHHREFFTDESAEQWAGRDDVFFVTDIRRGGPAAAKEVALLQLGPGAPKKDLDRLVEEIVESDIAEDMFNQERWIKIMRPVESLVKFHLPFAYQEGEIKPFPYLGGVIYLQIWPGRNSTETRLVPTRDAEGNFVTRQWDPLWYERALFYHNAVVREEKPFLNPFTLDSTPIDGEELLNDYDSAAEIFVLRLYIQRVLGSAPQNRVLALSRYITKVLDEEGGMAKTRKMFRSGKKVEEEDE